MTYKDLTLHQRISLKGVFMTDESMSVYASVMKYFGWIAAINYFLDVTNLPAI